MNSKVDDKLKAVIRCTKDLERASKTLGRIGIRNARRSLWARIRALQEECDVQYQLPQKKIPAPTWEDKAARMTAAGFDREIGYPSWWLKNIGGQDLSRVTDYFNKASEIVSQACAHNGVALVRLDAGQIYAGNITGSGVIGLKELSFGGFFRQLAKWIMHRRGELKYREKRRPGQAYPPTSKHSRKESDKFTDDMIARVNLKMVELLRVTGYSFDDQAMVRWRPEVTGVIQ